VISFRAIGKVGLIARALVYIAIAIILLSGVTNRGEPSDGADPKEAFNSIDALPLGTAVLLILAAGLLSYSAFRFVQAYTSDDSQGWKKWVASAGMISSGLSYASVAIAAIGVSIGFSNKGSAGGVRTVTDALLSQPFGWFAITILGLIFLAIGALQIYRVISENWKQDLDLQNVPYGFVGISQFAIFGRGLLIIMAGASITWAGIHSDTNDAMGLTKTLAWLRDQPFGLFLYLISSSIFAGYGVYGLLQAKTYRFRK
jgi:uncharacterized membrane protein (DUF2068 family)